MRRVFAREETEEEINEFSRTSQYFVPRHLVVNQDSVTTKRRVVLQITMEILSIIVCYQDLLYKQIW